jgi:hypothetical protein
MRPFMPHQQAAFNYSKQQQHIALLMEMRLGKTIVTIRWYVHLKARHILVLAPGEAMDGWEDNLSLEGETWVNACGLTRSQREAAILEAWERGERGERVWLLLNYEAARTIPELAIFPWDGVVGDESTKFRNPKIQLTRLMCDGFGSVAHRAILTGMYAPESPLDAFCQFRFLDGHFMGYTNFWKWREKYFQLSKNPWEPYKWEPKPGTRRAIKTAVAKRGFIMTRKQAQMPSNKVYQTRMVEMSPAILKLYKQAEEYYELDSPSGITLETVHNVVKETWLARLCGGFHPDGSGIVCTRKADEFVNLVTGELAHEKVIGWFRFNEEIAYMKNRLRKEGVATDHIQGGMLKSVRKAKWEAHRLGDVRVNLVQIMCARYGVDASYCDTEIYYSNAWSNEARTQSEERIEHPLNKTPKLVLDMVMKDTVDEDVVAGLKSKQFDSRWLMNRIVERAERRKKVTRSARSSQ